MYIVRAEKRTSKFYPPAGDAVRMKAIHRDVCTHGNFFPVGRVLIVTQKVSVRSHKDGAKRGPSTGGEAEFIEKWRLQLLYTLRSEGKLSAPRPRQGTTFEYIRKRSKSDNFLYQFHW
ncbi:hypothetical protein Mapa_001364 [Marchantia paleacea]|nr:hypothetical protein Mapa_001364 [Marchantia paleacea]